MKKRRLELLPEVLPAPNRAGGETPRDRTLRALNRLATAAAAAAALGSTKCNNSGYAVVDPMPAPSRCEGLAATIVATATPKSETSLVLVMKTPTFEGASYVDEPPYVTRGKLLSSKIVDGALEIEIEPEPNISDVGVAVTVSCPSGKAHVGAQIQLHSSDGGTDASPSSFQVNLNDYS